MAPQKKSLQQRNRSYLVGRLEAIEGQIAELRAERLRVRELLGAVEDGPAIAASIAKPEKKPKQPKQSKEDKRKPKLPEGWAFRRVLTAAEFLKDLRSLRINSGIGIADITASAECSDKMLYAVETGTQYFRKDTFTRLAETYGVTVSDIGTAFHWNGRYVREGDECIKDKPQKPVKAAKQPKAKKEKPIGELRKARAEKQNKKDPSISSINAKQPNAKPGGVVAAFTKLSEGQQFAVPSNLKYREGEPGHSIKAYITRNYPRVRNIVKGLCTQRLWDFEETMAATHDELYAATKLPISDQPNFYGDNERFISWVMALCKSLNKPASEKVSRVEDIITGNAKKTEEYDEQELIAYFKESLKYKPDYYKVVIEKYVFGKLPVDAAARAASITADKAANALHTVKGELLMHFKEKYRNLIKI